MKFLKSFTQIDLTVKDKEGQTPKEVACQRLGSSAEAKHRMERLIDGRCRQASSVQEVI